MDLGDLGHPVKMLVKDQKNEHENENVLKVAVMKHLRKQKNVRVGEQVRMTKLITVFGYFV